MQKYSLVQESVTLCLDSPSCPPQGVTSGVIGMSLQWIMKYPNAKPVDMKCTMLLAREVDYEFACFAERLL